MGLLHGRRKKEVTQSELTTTLPTRKTWLRNQATTRRRCYPRKIARHTRAPSTHSKQGTSRKKEVTRTKELAGLLHGSQKKEVTWSGYTDRKKKKKGLHGEN
jgi:hypothetical protein